MVHPGACGGNLHRLRAGDALIVDLLHIAEDKVDIIIHRPHEALTGDQLPISSPDHSCRLPHMARALDGRGSSSSHSASNCAH